MLEIEIFRFLPYKENPELRVKESKRFKKFQNSQNDFQRFKKIPKDYEMFQKILKKSKRF